MTHEPIDIVATFIEFIKKDIDPYLTGIGDDCISFKDKKTHEQYKLKLIKESK